MGVSARPAMAGGDDFNTAQLRLLMEDCRTELASGRAAVLRDGRDGQEKRLDGVAARLESAVQALERAMEGQAARIAADVLAREADHRIRNNLQMVVALLHRQEERAESEPVRMALRAAGARVQAITSLHAALHGASGATGLLPQVDLGLYLPNLCGTLAEAAQADEGRREVLAEVDGRLVPPEQAQALGLIVAELVTNALRHAFVPGRAGTVRVSGRAKAKNGYVIVVRDNGRGLPAGFDLRQRGAELGLRVVNVLVGQVRGKLDVDGRAGARFRLTLPPG